MNENNGLDGLDGLDGLYGRLFFASLRLFCSFALKKGLFS
jgi:hypothetical protein